MVLKNVRWVMKGGQVVVNKIDGRTTPQRRPTALRPAPSMQSDLAWMTIEEVAPLVARRAVSPRDLLESVFRRIQQDNSALNAYMTLDLERARADAQRAEAEILRDHHRGPSARDSDRAQGQHLDSRPAHHGRLENSGRLRTGGRRDRRSPAAARRRRDRRQDEHERVRVRRDKQ